MAQRADPKRGLSSEEVVRQGHVLYERIRNELEMEQRGKRLALDVHTGQFEVADDSIAAVERLRAPLPEAVVFGLRIGYPPPRIGTRLFARKPCQ